MAAPRVERLLITPRSAVVAVALLGLTLLVLRVLAASQRVLGWVLAAAALAGLLHPLVARLDRRLPRGLALGLVALLTVGTVGLVVYEVFDSLSAETARLGRAAPAAARRLEADDGRVAELAVQARFSERVQRFVDEVPDRLRGGSPAQAFRSAATRGVAYLATGVLTLFFLSHGAKLAAAAAAQVRDPRRRAQVERVARAAFLRGFGYTRATLVLAVAAGLTAYGVASAADVPGAAPLALWVALWDVVPVFGAVVGALPIVALGGIGDPGRALALAVVFVVYEVIETVVFQRRVERRTVRVGPFLTVAGGYAGLELYGIGGALMSILVLALVVAALDEAARPEAVAALLPAPEPEPEPVAAQVSTGTEPPAGLGPATEPVAELGPSTEP